jgi:hypothetical protein
MTTLRRLVYLYFFLLVFEGALRKWALPSLAGPLLLVRDPVVLGIYVLAIQRGIFPWNRWVIAALVLAAVCAVASLAAGCPVTITLFGMRTDFWQVPFIFLLPAILDGGEARRMGRWMLVILPVMALLALLQFRAGPDHWLNATTGAVAPGEGSQQLYAAEGRVRPSGTFSFVTGMVSFLSLGAAFVFEEFIEAAGGVRLWLAVTGLVLALGISGSRSAILCVAAVGATAVVTCLGNPRRLRRLALPVVTAAAAFVLLHGLADFREGLDVNKGRFDSGGGLQEGIVYRWFGDFVSAWESEKTAQWLGAGLGMGTSVGAGLATGTRQFLLAEGEWARVILESGPVLGLAVIALRMGIAVLIFRAALRVLRERGDALPMLILAAGALDLTTGQWGQATVSGFAVLAGGLSLAAGNAPEEEPVEEREKPVERPVVGRGALAARIKGGRAE